LAVVPRKEPVLSTDIYQIDMSEVAARIAQIIADNAPPEAARSAPKVGKSGTSVRGTRLSANE
jgi:hypothetical protein